MNYKIYSIGNYLRIQNIESGEIYNGLLKEVFVDKNNLNNNLYKIQNVKDWSERTALNLNQIKKEDGSDYTLIEWETFYSENTGNFNSGGSSSLTTDEEEAIQGANNPSAINPFATMDDVGGGVSLGETSTTAYRGDRGKTAYDHSQDVTTNPHNVTKSQVGLSNVDNTTDLNKPISTATQTALNNKQDALVSATNIKTINGNTILGSGDLTISSASPLTDWIPNYGGFSAQPSGGFNRYSLQGTLCNFAIQPSVNGTSNGNTLTATLPFLAKYLQTIPVATSIDAGTQTAGGFAFTTANSNVLTFIRPSGNWSTINPKRATITGWYEIANDDKKLIFHGNSLFEYGDSNLRFGNAVSNFVRTNLVTKRAIFDYSFANKTTRQLTTEFPTLIAPYFKAGDVLVMWDLTNDLQSGQTPAQALVNLKAYCAQAKAMGLKVYILTCIPRDPASLNDANRVTLNNSIMADTSFCDGVIDVTTIAEFSTSTSYLNTTFYNADRVHLTTAGYNLIGQRIINTITF